MHPRAFDAALYAEAAREQGKFEEMHDLLYAKDARLAPDDLERDARQLHLDLPALRKSLKTTARMRVRADMDDALAFDLSGTPTLLLCEPGGRARQINFQELETAIAP